MHWFRSRIRLGGRLALFALALQLLLSFGHVHLQAFAGASTKGALGSSAARSNVGTPAHPSEGLADTDCPICALIQLAAASAPSVPPILPLPAEIRPIGVDWPAESPLAASPQLLFRARAPPSI